MLFLLIPSIFVFFLFTMANCMRRSYRQNIPTVNMIYWAASATGIITYFLIH